MASLFGHVEVTCRINGDSREPDRWILRSGPQRGTCSVGRDPAEIEVTAGITVRYPGAPDGETPALRGTPAEIAGALAAHAAAGVDHVTVVLEPFTADTLAAFVEAVALYRASAG